MRHIFNLGACGFVCAGAAGADSRFSMIDYPGASSTRAWGINSRGDIVGYYAGNDKNNHGFLATARRPANIDCKLSHGPAAVRLYRRREVSSLEEI